MSVESLLPDMDEDAGPLAELSAVATALVLAPAVDDDVTAASMRLLITGDPDAVVAVAVTPSAAEWVDRWREHVGPLPSNLALVTTGDGTVDADATVDRLSSPGDLTGLGMRLSDYLQRFTGRDERIGLCFDSLTTVLQYSELHNVYRFLHLMTTRLSGAGARAHFHLDPATQDQQAVSTLASAFEGIARREDDGTWTVRTR